MGAGARHDHVGELEKFRFPSGEKSETLREVRQTFEKEPLKT